MIIHLINTCSAFDYLQKVEVKRVIVSRKLHNLAINVEYKEVKVLIPLSNIAAIEEND
jgi:hypothetical protein